MRFFGIIVAIRVRNVAISAPGLDEADKSIALLVLLLTNAGQKYILKSPKSVMP